MRNTALFVSILLGLAVLTSACADQVSEPEVSVHPANFVQPSIHGQFVLESPNDAASCATCHGEDYRGGTSGVSCYRCHEAYPHPDGFAVHGDPAFHEQFIAQEIAWHIDEACTDCHGSDFAGAGAEQKSCLQCHDDGPTSCATCHGSDDNIAPPVDLENNTEPTAMGVGVHQAHVGDLETTDLPGFSCLHCHPSPGGFAGPSHLDAQGAVDPAEIAFSDLASNSGQTNPVWDPAAGTCSDVYCHGNFTFERDDSAYDWAYADAAITGNGVVANWTAPEAQELVCGTCHGLPPTGHIQTSPRVNVDDCSQCHGRVVDGQRQIIDKDLHINGQVEVF